MDNHEVADILEKAAEYLDANGWNKGWYQDGDSVCAIGAIQKVINPNIRLERDQGTGRHPVLSGETYFVRKVLDEPLRTQYIGIDGLAQFNDDVAKNVSEVTDLFRTTAKDLRA